MERNLTILPTNQLLAQVWDYAITRPAKRGEHKKELWNINNPNTKTYIFYAVKVKKNAGKFLEQVKKELNISENIELSPHTLRRCFATYQAISGMPLPVLQKVLGHSKISTTALYIRDRDLSNLQLTERIANNLSRKRASLTKSQIESVINELLTETKKALVKGETIRFPSYYSLTTAITKPRVAMNLQTKKKMNIPAKRVPKIKFSADLKAEVAKKK
ncbi:12849_t:CDS:2 [Ambispora gerdemannii]|uniref:12849_t:CDS:1 n=1 Tax=Ambispora gerdemannii TaxID=144530 RepID=A0A9N9DCE7_9GLOM|nr:12849_t:CDS:2 [Ambispora gerdemannii]